MRDLCLVYRVSVDERDRLMALAVQAFESTWQDAATSSVYETFIGLEASASEMAIFSSHVLPGLLKTETYARALISGIRPPGFLSAEQVDEMVRFRMRRQPVLEVSTLSSIPSCAMRWRFAGRSAPRRS